MYAIRKKSPSETIEIMRYCDDLVAEADAINAAVEKANKAAGSTDG